MAKTMFGEGTGLSVVITQSDHSDPSEESRLSIKENPVTSFRVALPDFLTIKTNSQMHYATNCALLPLNYPESLLNILYRIVRVCYSSRRIKKYIGLSDLPELKLRLVIQKPCISAMTRQPGHRVSFLLLVENILFFHCATNHPEFFHRNRTRFYQASQRSAHDNDPPCPKDPCLFISMRFAGFVRHIQQPGLGHYCQHQFPEFTHKQQHCDDNRIHVERRDSHGCREHDSLNRFGFLSHNNNLDMHRFRTRHGRECRYRHCSRFLRKYGLCLNQSRFEYCRPLAYGWRLEGRIGEQQ